MCGFLAGGKISTAGKLIDAAFHSYDILNHAAPSGGTVMLMLQG